MGKNIFSVLVGSKKISLIYFLLLVYLVLPCRSFAQTDLNAVQRIQLERLNSDGQILIQTETKPNFTYFMLPGVDSTVKLIIDVRNAINYLPQLTEVNQLPLKRIRTTQWYQEPAIVRISLDFTEQVDYQISEAESGILVHIPLGERLTEDEKYVLISPGISIKPLRKEEDVLEEADVREEPLYRKTEEEPLLIEEEIPELEQIQVQFTKPQVVISDKESVSEEVLEPIPSGIKAEYEQVSVSKRGETVEEAMGILPPSAIPTEAQFPAFEQEKTAEETKRRFPSSEKLEFMKVKNGSLVDALRVISEQYDLNILTAKDVQEDQITFRLKNVSLEAALEAILAANGYDYWQNDNIIVVKGRDNTIPEDLITEVFDLKYVNGEDIIKMLTVPILSDRGKVQSFIRQNIGVEGYTMPQIQSSLAAAGGGGGGATQQEQIGGEIAENLRSDIIIVTDYPWVIEQVRDIIDLLDKPAKQIHIEVKLVETKLGDRDRWGINWTATLEAVGLGGKPATSAGAGGGMMTTEAAKNIPGSPILADGFRFGTLSYGQITALMELLESRGDTRLLNRPSITVEDNQQGDIAVGTVYPIEVSITSLGGMGGAGGGGGGAVTGTSIIQTSVAIQVTVVPHVNDDEYITMWVRPEVSEIVGYTGKGNDLPIKSVRATNTQVRVKNGDSIIIGGIIKEDKVETMKKVKFLGSIPLVGKLFTHRTTDYNKSELLIFITPTIIEQEDLFSSARE